MSKHLRFGRLLSLLAVMLTMSFAWAQGQNLSSEKVLSHLKFTAGVSNSSSLLYDDVSATIDQTLRTVTLQFPYRYKAGERDAIAAVPLKAYFKSSDKSNVFWGTGDATLLTVGNAFRTTNDLGQGLGIVTNAPWITANHSFTYGNGQVLTVEAENHSYVYYTVVVTYMTNPSTLSTMSGLSGLWSKTWGTICSPSIDTGAAGLSAGTSYTLAVPYGTTSTTITFTVPAFSRTFYGSPTPSTEKLPSPNFGATIASPMTFTLTVTNGVTLYVRVIAQDGTTLSNYNFTTVIGVPSLKDTLVSLTYVGADVPIDRPTQTATLAIPNAAGATSSAVVYFMVSKYAKVYPQDPASSTANEMCSPVTFSGLSGAGPWVRDFWVNAEKTSEISHYVLTITRAACSSDHDLLAINGYYSKANPCDPNGVDSLHYPIYHGTVTGRITNTNASTGTIVWDVPNGVTSIKIGNPFVASNTPANTKNWSYLATTTSAAGNILTSASTVAITSECGNNTRTYSVSFNSPAAKSDAKQLLSFGFNYAQNTGLGFTWNSAISKYEGVINPDKTVVVTVPWVTDLHQLRAYFTSDLYSCVYIANTNGYDPQVSNVNWNDHSNRLTYVVRAENGTEERYEVVVNKQPVSTDNTLNTFALTSLPVCDGLGQGVYDVEGSMITYNGNNIGVSVKNGTTLTALSFRFKLGAAIASVAISSGSVAHTAFTDVVTGTANFTSPVTITVTAEDLTTRAYVVTVTPRAVNGDKVLTSYKFEASKNTGLIGINDAVGAIDQTTRVVTVHVPNQSIVSNLVATFQLNGVPSYPGGAVMTHSEDPQVIQFTGVTGNDFREQVAYTIWGEDCTTLEYFVNVIVDPNKDNDLLSLTLTGVEKPECASCETPVPVSVTGTITEGAEGAINVQVPYGTDLAHIVLTGAPSTGATVAPLLNTITSYTVGVPQVVWVTAANGISKKKYTITVTKAAALTGNALLTFGFEMSHNTGLTADRWTATPINNVTYRIDVKVPFGTNVSALVASFTHSPMACVYTNGAVRTTDPAYLQCSGSVRANNFGSAVTYTVKAQNGAEAYYNIYVTQDTPLTEKALTVFKLTGMGYCPGLAMSPASFEIPGTGTTAIAVSVKAGTNLAAVNYAFTVSASATVSASNGTPVKNGTAVTGVANFTTPVTITVTAQDGSTQAYVVTVTPRAVNSAKQLTKYWLKSSPVNPFGGADAVGTINETEKKVEVWVPWGTDVRNLVANFELNNLTNTFPGGAYMTHSEDIQYVQFTGVTGNDFTTPVAYTVVAEDCTTVEYFVTVKMTPNTDTGISAFAFTYTDCGCDLTTRIDAYARRIYVTVPSTVSISSLAPTTITITPAFGTKPAASISPAVGVAQNWSNGPVKYTVTAPDGVTKADWMVYVTNPKCTNTDILAFSLPNDQVSDADLVGGFGKPVVIDAVNHKIDVIIKKDRSLTSVYYERTLPCGATVCCVGGNCQDNHYLDFSQGGCHTCVVTAQDQTVTQEWTICVHTIDVTPPTVKTWSVMAYNCTDSVAVQSNELGRVFIVNEKAINMSLTPSSCIPMYNLADWTGTGSTSVAALINNRMGNWATVTAVDTPVYVKTNGLYGGTYWAFSVDASGRMSCISTERLYLDVCDVTVATLCDLRNQPDVWRYTLSQEVFVNYEETRVTGGNWKFVQSADCGILVEDRVNALPASYGIGAGLTNLKGMLDKSGITMKFIPVCCYTPTKSSTGNVIVPKDMTYAQFKSDVWTTPTKFESMLVRITTPMKIYSDYDYPRLSWSDDGLEFASIVAQYTTGGVGDYFNYFVQDVLNSSLVGKVIPTGACYYTGLRTNADFTNWGQSFKVVGLITPRIAADIVPVIAPVITATPNPVAIDGVLPGNCLSKTITIWNEGVGDDNITALYLDDSPAKDQFNLITPPAVPFVLGSWTSKTVTVNFCPLTSGPKSTNLIVEYNVGKTLVIPITGTTVLINTTPFCDDFNADAWGGNPTNGGWTTNGAPGGGNAIGIADVGWWGNGTRMGTSGNAYTLYAFNGMTVYSITPGFAVTGTSKYLTFYQGKYDYFLNGVAGTAPATDWRKVYVSTDGQATWTEIYTTTMDKIPEVHLLPSADFQKVDIPLAAYDGKTVFFKFAATRTSANRGYWHIENLCVADLITYPVISVTPNPGNFGGVQVGAVGTLAFSIKNVGISVLKVKNVSIAGAGFTMTNTNAYPFEVTDGPGTWAYTVGAAGSSFDFSVDFKPTDIGVKTGKITITYGLYSDQTLEIPLTGEGLSCYTAAVAVKGQNYAPSQNTWFKYTADKFSIVQVTSCDVHQKLAGTEYAWDTFLNVYSNCTGTLIASNDDMEAACTYNRASSSVQTVVNAGETIYIFWPLSFPTALHAYEGFYFNINVTYPIDGDVCENAIPLTLPVVNLFGTTVGFNDDYNVSPCSPFSNYMDGNDKVYTITVTSDGYLTGSILGAYGSIHVLDVCPKTELTKDHCKAFVGGPNGGTFTHKKLVAGTYFVIISTWAPPQTVDFLLNLSWESGSAVDNADLMSTLNVYPNPNTGRFTVNISNPEAADMTLELVNISGQVVYRNQVKAAYSYNEDIDASSFAKGVYYLKVNNGKGVKVEKVVVQ